MDPVMPALNVYEPEEQPVDTGLYDAHGVKLYRMPAKIRPGYLP